MLQNSHILHNGKKAFLILLFTTIIVYLHKVIIAYRKRVGKYIYDLYKEFGRSRQRTVYTRSHVALVLSAPPPMIGALRKLNRFVLCPSDLVQSGFEHAHRTYAMLALRHSLPNVRFVCSVRCREFESRESFLYEDIIYTRSIAKRAKSCNTNHWKLRPEARA